VRCNGKKILRTFLYLRVVEQHTAKDNNKVFLIFVKAGRVRLEVLVDDLEERSEVLYSQRLQ
jgi:hypothetical protein